MTAMYVCLVSTAHDEMNPQEAGLFHVVFLSTCPPEFFFFVCFGHFLVLNRVPPPWIMIIFLE